jgi:2-keto-4-pentenoate hydratase/2-oxohepta-3-ene-1,7-dioic acid hydratase in catechol pathway
MHFKIPFLIGYLSQHFTLCQGDIILTGTPEGVGPIHSGDLLEASIHEKGRLVKEANFRVA